MKTIGERIVFLREEQNISQKELAVSLQITAATLSRYENDIYDPKGSIVVALAKQLHTTTDFLLGLTDYYMPPSRKQTSMDFTAQEYRMLKYYRMLNQENKIRTDERMTTLLELQRKKASS
jgi:transcriptional regulator with XRE-family HTH domain